MNKSSLDNRKIGLVTGASSEIGVAIAEKLVSMGFFVFAQYSSHVPLLSERVRDEISLIKVDFLSDKDLDIAIKELLRRAPHFDIIINCAALHEKYLRKEKDEYSTFQKVSKVNVFAPLYIVKKLHKKMTKREDPLVVFISSFYSHKRGSLLNIFYAATKTSLLTISRILAIEYVPMRSNVIIPGYVNTKTYKKGRSDIDIKRDIDNSLNGSLVPVIDIVKAIEFVISNKSINATEIKVDGGLHI